MIKKFTSVVLVLILVLSSLSAAFADDTTPRGVVLTQIELEESLKDITPIEITADTVYLQDGYYCVPSGQTVKLASELSVMGNATLELQEGAVLEGPDDAFWTIAIDTNAVLNITGSGKIIGNVFVNSATLNMYGGVIENPTDFSYCVDAEFESTFNMYGGTLQNSYFGLSASSSKVNITDGEIKGCTYGIQAYSSSDLTLVGGTISDCHTGIYYNASNITLGGSLKVIDNQEHGIECWDSDGFFISEEVPPTDEMNVGIEFEAYAPFCGEESEVEGVSGEYVKYFFSANSEYYFVNDNGTWKILNRFEEFPDDYNPTFKLNDKALEGKTVEYQWYSFEKTEIKNDEQYISFASSDDERYSGVTRSYNKSANAWIIENPIDDTAYYEDQDSVADLVLHVPAKTFVSLHGVLQGYTNQYEIGINGTGVGCAYSSYENVGVDLGDYVDVAGDYNLFAFYYADGYDESEEETTEEKVTPKVVISHLTYWTMQDEILSTTSTLDDSNLPGGYYVCKAVIKENGDVTETLMSDIVWAGKTSKPYYDEEDAEGYGLTASIFSFPQIAFIIAAVVAVIAIVVVVIVKKKKKAA